MCIKTLKNKNRVVGLCINGKNFMLDKQICHALTVEEQRVQNHLSEASNDISQLKSVLDSSFFVGESDLLNVAVKFRDNGEIDVNSAQVEFKSIGLSDNENQQAVKLLESFLKAINCSIQKQRSELEKYLTELSQKAG